MNGTENRIMKVDNKKSYLYIISYFIPGLSLSVFMFRYLKRAIGCMPCMDFWIDSKEYLEDVISSVFLCAKELFPIPHSLHSAPLNDLLFRLVLKLSRADNRAFVYTGYAFMMVSLILIIAFFHKYFSVKNPIVNCCGAFLVLFPFVNLNQWEILTLYCNCTFMFRILLYLLLWYFFDRFLHCEKDWKGWKKWLLFLFGIVIIFWCSQAYYAGMVSSVSAVLIVELIIRRPSDRKESIKEGKLGAALLINLGWIFWMIFTLATINDESVTDRSYASEGVLGRILDYVKGMILGLGASVIPQSEFEAHPEREYAAGIVIFLLALLAVFIFFRLRIFEKTYMPLILMVYAFVTLVTVCFSRIGSFGLDSLSASRYVTETTLGLMGMVCIYWYAFTMHKEKIDFALVFGRLFSLASVLFVVMMVARADYSEWQLCPYRKIYNDNMTRYAYNIDEVSDSELKIFQSSAENVRGGISVLKEHRYSIWQDDFDYIKDMDLSIPQ